MKKYSFSGHESFYCKSLWLKKGYDFLAEGRSFLDDDAVVRLGVGKNMVTAIRFWLKAFGLTVNDQLTPLAKLIFDSEHGCDSFVEDTNTLWLLHYGLVRTNVASMYNLLFTDYQREKKEFDKASLDAFIQRKCSVPEQKNVYNANTVNKDMGVMIKSYFTPENMTAMEDFSALLINLNLLRRIDKDTYAFNETPTSAINPAIIFYAILDSRGDDATMSFDKIQELALTFCMSVPAFTSIVRDLEKSCSNIFHYTENSGIRNIQFLRDDFDKYQVLTNYYTNLTSLRKAA